MNDYKELIKRLRVAVDVYEVKGCVLEISAELCAKIADAIEQLVDEREETAYLLKQYIPYLNDACDFCIHKNAKSNTTEFIENCNECNEAQHYCCWEYGGLSESMKTLMELNKIVKSKIGE